MEAELQSVFEEQLLEFVEEREEPFNAKFLVMACNQPISEMTVSDTLRKLEDKGKIISVGPGLFISTRTLLRRVLKKQDQDENAHGVLIPRNLIEVIKDLINGRSELGYETEREFVKEAIRWHLHMYGVF